MREVPTATGPARVHVHLSTASDPAVGTLVLGHGAGGGIEAPDLQALTGLTVAGWQVVLVEQPWRVAGRRIATPPPTLDLAWLAVLSSLVAVGEVTGMLVVGGRSAGARVACRTATAVEDLLRAARVDGGPANAGSGPADAGAGPADAGAGPAGLPRDVGARAVTPLRLAGVLALAFPLRPPGRGGPRAAASRAYEAAAVLEAGLPLAVVQGDRDPFGTPAQVAAELGPGATVRSVRGAHSFSTHATDVVTLTGDWLRALPTRPDGNGGGGHRR